MLNKIIPLAVVCALVFHPAVVYAKVANDQDQIILLNDSAAALEDSNPELSKRLTQFADEKQKEWEEKNANKTPLPQPLIDKTIAILKEKIKLLRTAADLIKTTYPLIAQNLRKMAREMNRTIEGAER